MLSLRVVLTATLLALSTELSRATAEYDFCVSCCDAFKDAKIDGDFQTDICKRDGCIPENRPKGCSYTGQGRWNKQRSCEIGRSYLLRPDEQASWAFDGETSELFYCSNDPSGNAVVGITRSPTMAPTESPTQFPTNAPTKAPTKAPTESPTPFPTAAPTKSPTKSPTESPTPFPTPEPTTSPTKAPTKSPTPPTPLPTAAPTVIEELAVPSGTTAAGTSLLVVGGLGVVAMLALMAVIVRKRRKRRGSKGQGRGHSRFEGNNANETYHSEEQGKSNPFRPIIGMGGRLAKNARALSVRIVNGMQRNPAGTTMTLNGPNPFVDSSASFTNSTPSFASSTPSFATSTQSFGTNSYQTRPPPPTVPQPPSTLAPPPGLPPLRNTNVATAPPPVGTPGLLPPRRSSYLDDDDSSFDNIQF